jgi:uncharacterized protein (DUF1684 family)
MTVPAQAQRSSQSYEQEMAAWYEKRVAELKAEDGWLNLAGLFWLQQGINSIGTDSSFAVQIPLQKKPALLGHLLWENDAVKLIADEKASFTINGQRVQDTTIYRLRNNQSVQVNIGTYRFHIIRRDTKLGVRLRNLAHPALQSFPGIDRYPLDTSFRVTARLVAPPGFSGTIPITNVLGQTIQMPSPGILFFQLHGKPYSLKTVEENKQLLIIFGDETNADETYGAGRFIYTALPGPDGMVVLDFNKAINPPCAFTPFATCPLPPVENRLPFPLRAGEKNFGKDKH